MGNIADSTANITAIILRALGQEECVFYGFLLAYYVIGLPAAYVMGIELGYGFKGVWHGLIIGYWVMLGLMAIRLFTLNWKENILKIHRNHSDDIEFLPDGHSPRTPERKRSRLDSKLMSRSQIELSFHSPAIQ